MSLLPLVQLLVLRQLLPRVLLGSCYASGGDHETMTCDDGGGREVSGEVRQGSRANVAVHHWLLARTRGRTPMVKNGEPPWHPELSSVLADVGSECFSALQPLWNIY